MMANMRDHLLVESGLVFVGNDQELVAIGRELVGQLLLADSVVHLRFGVKRKRKEKRAPITPLFFLKANK